MEKAINKSLCFGAKSNAPKNKPIDISKVQPTLINKDKEFKKPKSSFLKWATRVTAVLGISLAMLMGCTFMNVGKAPIPDTTQVYENLNTMNIGTEILTKNDNGTISRFINAKGDPIKVNISDEFNADEKQVIQECLDIYNKAFEVINPEYKFVVDDKTSALEKIDPDYIQIAPIGALEGNTVAYETSFFTPTINGLDTAYNKVFMGEASRENLNMFRNTFLHEFMHALGVADAYLVDGFYEGTIMDYTATNTKTNDLYKYDIALLAALYGDFSTPEKVEIIKNFVENYGANSSYTDTSHCKYTKKSANNIKTTHIEENEEGLSY